MISFEEFYQIKGYEPSTEGVRINVVLNPYHAIYSVHFPNNPITPGVVLLQIATRTLEKMVGKKLRLRKVESMRFKAPLHPEIEPTFILRLTNVADDKKTINATVRIEAEEKLYAKMKLVFEQ